MDDAKRPAHAVTGAVSPAVQAVGLSKAYRVYGHPRERLWALLTGRSAAPTHWALRDVDFHLVRGQCLGVVGNNGAGKSTLLKLLTRSLQPSQGVVHVNGRLTAILELGAGFHPEFSGRDNLYFGGSLIGINAAQMDELLPSIVEFAELAHALDRSVKTYSSGMLVRLAFALVTAVEPDVLIIDEALAVGDQTFQKKCVERIEQFKQNGCTILFCSHSLYHIRRLCDVSIWLDKGSARAFGDTETVLSQYETHIRSTEARALSDHAEPLVHSQSAINPTNTESGVQQESTFRSELVECKVHDLGAEETPVLRGKHLKVTLCAQVAGAESPNFGVMLEQAVGTGITAVTTHTDGVRPERRADGLWHATVTFTDLPLFSGDYVVSAYLFDESGLVVYDEWLKHQCFRVIYPSVVPGIVRLPHVWG